MNKLLLILLCAVPAAAVPAFVPAPTLNYDPTPTALLQDCRDAQKRAASTLAGVASLPQTARTFDNTPWAFERVLAQLYEDTSSGQFMKHVSVSSAARSAGNDCETEVGKFFIEVFSREDLYKALKDYAAKGESLKGDSARLLEKQLLDFRRSGLELPASERARLTIMRKRLTELESQFSRNINESKDFALFTRAEMDGAPEDFVARLEKVDGKHKVTLDYPDFFPFMDNVRVGASRKILEGKFNNRASRENLSLLDDILSLRKKAARILGYPSHAAFILETRMAKDPATVKAFIDRLKARLRPLAEDELVTLKALKVVFEGKDADPVFRAWDWRFYDNQLKRVRYSVDEQQIREYFPADLVTEQMLAVYQKLLGVKFKRVENASLWHPDVKLFSISEAAGGEPFAYFYMDMFPREGKYKHAAAFDLIKGRLLADGTYRKPVSAIVANFDKPTAERPSLLTHDDVDTYFHEFGHIMHQTLTRARFSRFSGSEVARDFVEGPSQMLENWVWDPEVLSSLSGHYQDRSKKLPKEMLDKMIAARNADSGLFNLRQLNFASIDQLYHTAPPSDTTGAYAKVMKEVFLIPMSEGTHPQAGFGHLMGYDAGYYGYLWSKVYAQDMFSRFEAEGIMNPAVGAQYRRKILEVGSSGDEMEALKSFLGRAPKEDAFLKSIGLKAE
ncbi:MAG: M3 family metallopeptidase [Elusimicrobiota bacterium]